jgi:hypothetical protein
MIQMRTPKTVTKVAEIGPFAAHSEHIMLHLSIHQMEFDVFEVSYNALGLPSRLLNWQ